MSGRASEKPYGIMAEFESAEQIIEATRKAKEAGYTRFDPYTPYPVEDLDQIAGHKRTRLSLLILIGGITGGCSGFGMMVFSPVYHYPVNIGGRPLYSWPAFIPITFELTILFAALTAAFGMLMLNGLPRLYHPVFNNPRFSGASRDRFFLCIESVDPLYDADKTERFLKSLNPSDVTVVQP